MARVVRLGPRYLARLQACGVRRGTPAAAAVGATLAALAEADLLPGLLDATALIPPTARALVRRVGGQNLWLWYRLDERGDVVMLTVTTQPPVPIG